MKNFTITYFKDPLNIINYLFILIPITLMFGNGAIPDIFLSIISLIFLIYSIKKKLINYYKNTFVYFLVFFCLYGVFRSIFSEYPIFSLSEEGTLFYFRYIFYLLAVIFILMNNKKTFEKFLLIIFLCIVFFIIDGSIQFVLGKNIFLIEAFSEYRVSSLMGTEPKLGSYIFYTAPIVIIFFDKIFKTNNKFFDSYLILFIGLTFLIIIFSGDRAPLLRYFIFLSGFIFLSLIQKNFKLVAPCLISLLLFSSVALINENVKTRIIDLTLKQISKTEPKYMPYSINYEEHYKTSFNIIKDHTLFGIGPKNFANYCGIEKYNSSELACATSPHNYYVQVFLELGLFGFLFLFGFYMSIIKNLFLSIFHNLRSLLYNDKFITKKVLINYYLFILLFPIIPNMSFYNNWANVFLITIIGIYIQTNYNFKFKNA